MDRDGDFELIGGTEHRQIRIVPYDPEWPAAFERERGRIIAALGVRALRIDHIGSTAVPGLAAKPIIDIDLSVEDPENEGAYFPALEEAGFALRVREPGHRMLRTTDLGFHLHVCAASSDWERRHLLFRDWLRRDNRDRDAYGELKRDLARRDWPDMNAYAEAKSDFITGVTARAVQWGAETHWRPAETA